MSLTLALQNAISGLQSTQGGMNVVSRNIANANTEGYTRKLVDPVSRIVDNQGAGVQLAEARRIIDYNLLNSVRLSTSDQNKFAAIENIMGEFELEFGSPGDDFSIASRVNTLRAELERLHAAPESTVQQNTVLETARELARAFQSLSNSIQNLREKADRAIKDAVDVVNTASSQIDELNEKIVANHFGGKSTADLEDLRDIEVNKIAEKMGVRTFTRSDASMAVMNEDSRFLVEFNAFTITFNVQGNIGPATSIGQTATPPDTGDLSIGGVAITNEITTGEIGGLLTIRDTLLVQAQAQLDELAGELILAFQATGSTGVLGTDTDEIELFHDGTGTYLAANEQGISQRIAVNSSIISNPWRLRDGTDATVVAQSTSTGDQTNLSRVLNLFDNARTFNNGSLDGSFTVGTFAGQFIGKQGQIKADYEDRRIFQEQVTTNLSQRQVNQSGVNIDEELANLIQIQNAYGAAARVISVVNDAFDDLLNIRF